MIPAAIIGLGRIASLLEDDPMREKPCTHAGALIATGRCTLAGGMDTDAERRRLFTSRWGSPVYEDARDMIRKVNPRILVIATHPDSHERYALLAARESVPVIVCEKPLAHSVRSARRIVRLEEQKQIRVVVNHERRFSRDYILVRNAIEQEFLGSLVGITATLYFGRSARHDRVLLHDGTHLVDAIHFITGDRLRLDRRVGALRSSRSSVFLHGRLKQRAIPVMIEVGAERNYLHLEITLSFSAGRIRIGNGIFTWERSDTSPHYSGYRSLVTIPRNVPEPTGYFRGMMEEAVRLVADPQEASRSTARDAFEALKVITRAR